MPKVTVLMPLYNGNKYIRECLNSVQAQTFTDWEFIIVNDFGSDDGCADVIRTYAEKDPRIILIQAEERLGLAASLNYGLRFAKGEYIARVDVDDPSYPDRFEKQVAYLDEHPDIMLVGTFQRSVSPTSRKVIPMETEWESLKASMLFGPEICHSTVMFRSGFFRDNGITYGEHELIEDHKLWTQLIYTYKMANIGEALVDRRWGFENISIQKGKYQDELRNISMDTISRQYHLDLSGKAINKLLFSGWNTKPREYASAHKNQMLSEGRYLLNLIRTGNEANHLIAPDKLDAVLWRRWNWIRESCCIDFDPNEMELFRDAEEAPVVSVVLPAYNSVNDISMAINSVLKQTFPNWELLVVNDFGSDDGTADIVNMYAAFDGRIRLIQAERRLGLAESLNAGIRAARGRYIARLDADDTSAPDRFEKQVAYLDAHPSVGICGTWQHHYGPDRDWVHEAPADPKTCKAHLLFWCDLCHSTLMLRRDAFVDNDLYYDPSTYAEDFELWTRAMEYMEIANIPEVLGEYKEDGTSITSQKFELLCQESGRIVANTLRRIWGVDLSVEDTALFNGWRNDYEIAPDKAERLSRLEQLLRMIWQHNQEEPFFDNGELLQTIAAKWYWAKKSADWKGAEYNVSCIDDVFNDRKSAPSLRMRYRRFRRNNPSRKVRIKKIIKKGILYPFAWLLRRFVWSVSRDVIIDITKQVEGWTWDRYLLTRRDIENYTWNRYTRIQKEIQGLSVQAESLSRNTKWLIPYYPGSKIRVVFLFQVASFWPSLDSLYHQMLHDSRFDVRLVCYDEDFDASIKTETAREYLESSGYDFIPWESFSMEDFCPHLVFAQTPYDTNRRTEYRMDTLLAKGHRTVLISYGIEIGNTLHARYDNFIMKCKNTWRVYTLSDRMRQEYLPYAKSPEQIKAFGLPKFDSLYHKEDFPQYPKVLERANGRKIVLWKVHFPKMITEFDKKILVTPDIQEYIAFAEKLEQFSDLFFVFMPHPRFVEFNEDQGVRMQAERLVSILRDKKNVYIDMADDYRPSLLNAEAIIIDRSSVMVEAAVNQVPVLYMSNADYHEPMPEAIAPLVDSYEQGLTCGDMTGFIERVRQGVDLKKQEREAAFRLCVPGFDGNCSKRIVEDIVSSLEREASAPSIEQRLDRIEAMLAELQRGESR